MNSVIEQALNEQIAMEGRAHSLYLSIASYYDTIGLEGVATFFYDQSAEEYLHMMKIFKYVNEMDGHALVPEIPMPRHTFDDPSSTFQLVYEHEQKVTASINKIVDLAIREKDHGTYNFLQWFVEEQREEETLMRSILDRIKLIGEGPQSLYFIDREIREINNQKPQSEGGK